MLTETFKIRSIPSKSPKCKKHKILLFLYSMQHGRQNMKDNDQK
jgi:hypothetical protein